MHISYFAMTTPIASKSDQYWKMLLNLSTAATSSAGSSTGSSTEPKTLTAEDQAWIESAIDELNTENTPVSLMTSYMMDIKSKLVERKYTSIPDAVTIENEIAQITEYCYDRDIAMGFCRMGGIGLAEEILSKTAEVRSQKCVAELVVAIAQNNPEVQDQINETSILELLIKCVNDEAIAPYDRKFFVSAISAVVRNNKRCFDKFIELNGFIKLASIALKADRRRQEVLLNRICIALTNIARGLEQKDIEDKRINWTLAETLLAVELDTTEGIDYLIQYFRALKPEESYLSADCWEMLNRKLDEYTLMTS
uniref:Fes1 domain-containing protein n=1 Tax=Steinernema glaseri TaxID=37863 RepID=A0A1I7YW94_9BILA